MARRAISLWVLVHVLFLMVAPSAHAHDHELPTAELHYRDLFVQQPTIETYCWVRTIPPWGTRCDDLTYHYPDAYRLEEAGETKLSIRFNKLNPPDKIYIRGWTYVDRYPQIDETYGRGTRFKAELRPTLGPTGAAWYADIVVPESKHWYLRAFAVWNNLDGRPPGSRQYVIWQFHVRMPVPPVEYGSKEPAGRQAR